MGGRSFCVSWDNVAGGESNRNLHAGNRRSLFRLCLCRALLLLLVHRAEGGHAGEVPFRFDLGEPESRDGRLVDHLGRARELGRGKAHHCVVVAFKSGRESWGGEESQEEGWSNKVREKEETHRHGPFLVASLARQSRR